jgi:hypothetical protein
MAYRLRMSAQLGDWLAELGAAQPPTAVQVAAALTLLLDGPDVPGPPLVTDLWGGSATDPDDQVVGLDYAYRRLLDQLTLLRGRAAAAGASTVATRVRIRRGQPPEPLPGTAAEVAAEEKRERKLKAAARHWSAAIDEFSRSKEVVQASYRTAAGARDAQRAICAAPGATETDQATAQAGVIAAERAGHQGRRGAGTAAGTRRRHLPRPDPGRVGRGQRDA